MDKNTRTFSDAMTQRRVVHVDSEQTQQRDDTLAVEEPLEIRIGDEPLAVTMRTPGHDDQLAAGFCFTEGILHAPDDLDRVEPCCEAKHDNVMVVSLAPEAVKRRQQQIACARRELYLSSSCGLCGKQSIDRIRQSVAPVQSEYHINTQTLMQYPALMRRQQNTFTYTGGLHAAALFSASGDLVVLREDVGRHNAVDKVIGHQLLMGMLPLSSNVLLVSGRTSFEIVQKAAMAGVPILAAVSAPSSLAVDLARELNMTLIGFLRGERMNIYCGEQRITN